MERENTIKEKITAVDGSGKCLCSSTWRLDHMFFFCGNKVRLSRADLRWLVFRETNRVPKVQEIAYYAEVGLLEDSDNN